MKKRIIGCLFRVNRKVIAIIIITVLFSNLQFVKAFGNPQFATPTPEETRMLNATVQIRMVALLNQDTGSPTSGSSSAAEIQSLLKQGKGYIQENGLGTIVSRDGISLILTHNHWGPVLVEADLVEIRSARNELLVVLNRIEWLSLIRYSDPGTLVLEAPSGLHVSPARLGAPTQVRPEQKVFLARHSASDPSQVEIVPASVIGAGVNNGIDTQVLKTSRKNAIVPGDSGGGMWLNGELIGNLWTTEGVYYPGLWGSSEELLYTGNCSAAQLPQGDWSSYLTNDLNDTNGIIAPQEGTNGAG